MLAFRSVLRLLGHLSVALLTIGVCVAGFRWGVLPLLDAVLPLSEGGSAFLRRSGVTASLLLAYWGVARYYERRAVAELAFRPLPVSLGAASGIVLIGLTLLPLFALGNYRVVASRDVSGAVPILWVILVAVVFEEVVFRGVIFRVLEQHAGTVAALLIQAVIFGTLHLSNAGSSAVTVVSVTLLGAFWTLIFVKTRNLWASVANHAAWNATIFLSGLPLSGAETWRLSAPIESTYEGSIWLTGGPFGPENSVVSGLTMTLAVGALAWSALRHGAFRDAEIPRRSPR